MRSTPTFDGTAAIVVTFHPDASVFENLASLRLQVHQLIVVDNGSSSSALSALQQVSLGTGFHLIANSENLGIATALNIGIRHAVELGCTAVFLFDQDSQITPGFTTAMLRCFQSLHLPKPLGILVPSYADRTSRDPLPASTLPDGTLATAITSGSLILAETFHTHGLFADELFIDSVDHEYSLRLRRSGLCLATCPHAMLLHAMGTPRPHTLLGFMHIRSTNYGPVRRYYQERNKIWMYRRYALHFPGFCAFMLFRSFVDLAKILLVESEKLKKASFMFRGVVDGLCGRMGPRAFR